MTGRIVAHRVSRIFANRTALVVVVAVLYLSLDAIFIALNMMWRSLEFMQFWPPRPDIIWLGNDYGIPEILNFSKCLLVAVLLLCFTPRNERHFWIPIAMIFLMLFADDAFRIHENVGEWFSRTQLFFPLSTDRLYDYGQLAYSATLGLFVYGTVILCFIFAEGAAAAAIRRFLVLLILLGFFGVLIDAFNALILSGYNSRALNSIGSLIENGGEMITLSLCVWAAGLAIQPRVAETRASWDHPK